MIPSLVDIGTKDLFKYVASKIQNDDILCELGVFVGGSIISLLHELRYCKKDCKTYAIDNFKYDNISYASLKEGNVNLDNGLVTFKNNLNQSGVSCEILVSDSISASSNFPDKSINFIFHDANHGYQGVVDELLAWKPKMNDRCFIMIHDWPTNDIQRAVREIYGEPIKVVDNGATAVLKDTL